MACSVVPIRLSFRSCRAIMLCNPFFLRFWQIWTEFRATFNECLRIERACTCSPVFRFMVQMYFTTVSSVTNGLLAQSLLISGLFSAFKRKIARRPYEIWSESCGIVTPIFSTPRENYTTSGSIWNDRILRIYRGKWRFFNIPSLCRISYLGDSYTAKCASIFASALSL